MRPQPPRRTGQISQPIQCVDGILRDPPDGRLPKGSPNRRILRPYESTCYTQKWLI